MDAEVPPTGRFARRFGRRSFAGVTSNLDLIAATSHEAPAGAHMFIAGALIVAVVVALVVSARRRRNAGEGTRAERDRSEP